MCGIAGFYGKPNNQILKKMTASIAHRGPDDEGFFETPKISLGMRRLKIIDLEGGRQPMSSSDGRYTIVFNGEIYNYLKLKKELKEKDAIFRTNSDTEVILEGYSVWQEEIFPKLDGMFGLAIWDNKEEKLVLARDRFGEKPLYYGWFGGSFIFGSEIKAILQHSSVKKELDHQALYEYLVYDYVPAPRSIFKGIYQILPGSYRVVEGQKSAEGKYWNLEIKEKQITEKDAADELEKKLEESVRSRMVSDVPLGVFLSGGLDSSAITYFAQKNSKQKIKTFSIGFEDQSFDESAYARQVAEHLGTDHHEHIFSTKDCLDIIPTVFDKLDQPFADASILPAYLLSKFTRGNVTVALDGDGSDELFGGYPTFQAAKVPLKNLIAKLAAMILPISFDNITLDYGSKRIAASSDYPQKVSEYLWIGSFLPKELAILFNKDFFNDSLDALSPVSVRLDEARKSSRSSEMLYLYQTLYLTDNILTKSDRASMAVGLESRAPFLSNDLSMFINSLPSHLKLSRLFKSKYLLKKVMQKYLPSNIVNRKKKGFGIPMARWLTSDLKPLLLTLLNKDRIRNEGYFNPDFVQKLIDQHMTKKADNRKTLWNLMAFQLWKEKWL